MVIERWTGPPVETHTYLVADEASGEAWVVDAPLDTAAAVLGHCAERGYTLTRAILTHGHFDHVLDAERYQEAGVLHGYYSGIEAAVGMKRALRGGQPLPPGSSDPIRHLMR